MKTRKALRLLLTTHYVCCSRSELCVCVAEAPCVCHIYFALYFWPPHWSLDRRGARARKEGHTVFLRHLPCLQLTVVCCQRACADGSWPGHIFYLFNYVSQQNLIVNKDKNCVIYFSNSLHLVCFCFFYFLKKGKMN